MQLRVSVAPIFSKNSIPNSASRNDKLKKPSGAAESDWTEVGRKLHDLSVRQLERLNPGVLKV